MHENLLKHSTSKRGTVGRHDLKFFSVNFFVPLPLSSTKVNIISEKKQIRETKSLGLLWQTRVDIGKLGILDII